MTPPQKKTKNKKATTDPCPFSIGPTSAPVLIAQSTCDSILDAALTVCQLFVLFINTDCHTILDSCTASFTALKHKKKKRPMSDKRNNSAFSTTL